MNSTGWFTESIRQAEADSELHGGMQDSRLSMASLFQGERGHFAQAGHSSRTDRAHSGYFVVPRISEATDGYRKSDEFEERRSRFITASTRRRWRCNRVNSWA